MIGNRPHQSRAGQHYGTAAFIDKDRMPVSNALAAAVLERTPISPYPSMQPTKIFDFTGRGLTPPGIISTRNSPKIYFDTNQNSRSVAAYEMPLEWDPDTGEFGRSIWSLRENLVRSSHDFSYAMSGFILSPSTPGYYEESGTGAVEHRMDRPFSTTAGLKYAFSALVDVPPVGRRISLRIVLSFGGESYVYIHSDKTFSVSGKAWEYYDVKFLAGDKALIRCAQTATTTTTGQVRLQSHPTTGANSFEADPSYKFRFHWIQAEQAEYPSPAIETPTTSGGTTRQADRMVFPTAGWYNPDEGTWIMRAAHRVVSATPNTEPFLLQVGGTHRMFFSILNTRPRLVVTTPEAGRANSLPTPVQDNVPYTLAVGYGAGEDTMMVRGEESTTIASDLGLPVPEEIRIGSSNSGSATSYLNGMLFWIEYYNKRLPLPELHARTS